MNEQEYKIYGLYNKWSIIDEYKQYYLLENCTYGDETFYVVVDKNTLNANRVYVNYKTKQKFVIPTFEDFICETYDGLMCALYDEDLISEEEYLKERE